MARLYSIDICHEHCEASGGAYRGIAIAPSPVTARRLKRYGLIWRRRPDGLDIFYSQGQARALADFMNSLPPAIRSDPPDDLFGEPLLFTMELRDPLFLNYTEAPTDIVLGRPCLFLSNRNASVSGEQEAAFTIRWDKPPYILPPSGASKLSAAPNGELLREPLLPSARERLAAAGIRDPDGGGINAWWMDSGAESAVARDEASTLVESMCPRPLGLIQLFANAPAASRATWKPEAWTGYPIDLMPPAEPTGNYDADGYLRPARYVASFPARATFWRYHFASRSDSLGSQTLSIADWAGAMIFEPAGTTILPDGTAASSFVAGASEKLRQHPTANYSLLGKPEGGRAGQRVLVQRLPTPTPDLILPDSDPDPPRIWSDIYVFL